MGLFHVSVVETGVQRAPRVTIAGLRRQDKIAIVEDIIFGVLDSMVSQSARHSDPGSVCHKCHPAAAISARLDVVEVADDLVAFVLLEVLIVDDRIAGFRSGVNAVVDLGLDVEVIAVALEMFIPVGKFDDDFDFGIGGAGAAPRISSRETSSIRCRRKSSNWRRPWRQCLNPI